MLLVMKAWSVIGLLFAAAIFQAQAILGTGAELTGG
jgi:hypothetical protein